MRRRARGSAGRPLTALRRATLAVPAVAIAWALLVGLPLAPRAGSPGHLYSSTVTLTGSGAEAVTPAGGAGAKARRTTGEAAKGWSAAVELSRGTQMVGLSWDATTRAKAGTLALRSRHGSAWSAWQAVDPDPDEGPDIGGNGRTGVGPLWLGSAGAEQVEVKVQGGEVANLSLLRMRWTDPTPGSPGQAHAEAAGPAIRLRTAWAPGGWQGGNTGCTKAPVVMNQLKFAVVHHTVNSNDYTAAQVPGILAGIYRYHTGSLGWCDIAYNFVIDRFGTVWQGRSGDINTPVLGGHAKGFNSDSVGIALLGQYEPGAVPAGAKPSAAQIASLESTIAWKLSIHGVDPVAKVSVVSRGSSSITAGKSVTIPTIIGHREVGSTDCPGQNVYDLLPAIRTDVESLIAKARTPAAWKPFTDPRAVAARQYQDFLGRAATNSEQAGWASRMQRDGTGSAPLIEGILASGEFADKRAPVVRLYLAYFKRIPDHGGLAHWWAALRNGTSTLDEMSSAFAASSEFERQYGTLDSTAFVERVYRNVLGRPPDPAGLAYWTGQIEQTGTSRGAVMTGFSESSENRRATDDQVRIITVYEAMLGRPATSASYTQWQSKLQQGSSIAELITQAYFGGQYADRLRMLG